MKAALGGINGDEHAASYGWQKIKQNVTAQKYAVSQYGTGAYQA
jgi:hypothetical protein